MKNTSGATPGLSVEVSTDKKTWSKNISTTPSKGYYLRTTPSYIGSLQSGDSASPKQWLPTTSDGTVFVTPQIMQNGYPKLFGTVKPGKYIQKFRPLASGGVDLPWSNNVVVEVKDDPQPKPSSNVLTTSSIRSCSKTPKQGKEINIATYNLGRAFTYYNNAMVPVSEFVKANGVDILILQEISITPQFSYVAELEALLKTHQNKNWYTNFQPHDTKTPVNSYGQMILSKYPIKETEKYLYDGKSGGDRYFMRYKVATPYGDLQVFNVHTRAEQERCAGTAQALEWIKNKVGGSSQYAVVGGDFNVGYSTIEGKSGADCSIPSSSRIFTRSCISGASMCSYDKIDHLFRPKNSKLKFSELCRQNNFVWNGIGASRDHHPVLATLRFD